MLAATAASMSLFAVQSIAHGKRRLHLRVQQHDVHVSLPEQGRMRIEEVHTQGLRSTRELHALNRELGRLKDRVQWGMQQLHELGRKARAEHDDRAAGPRRRSLHTEM